MDLEAIKAEVAGMSEEQQNRLAAFLVHLRHRRDNEEGQSVASRGGKRTEQWISLDRLKEKWNGQ
jgi:hypothetical protein